MITATQQILLNFGLGFVFGSFPFFLLFRGFLIPFLTVKLSNDKYLLRVHFADGTSTRFKVGTFWNTIIIYKFGKEEFMLTISKGVIKRTLGVAWLDVNFNDSTPFNYEKVQPFYEEIKNKEGEVVSVTERFKAFIGYDDSRAVMVAIRTALMQPRKGFGLGNIDFKKLLIVGGIIVVAVIVVMKLKENGGNII